MEQITEMDLDFLVNESHQSEGIVGTIYYSEIKVEPDSETSTDSDASQNDVDEPVISTEADENFQLQGSSTDVTEVLSRNTDKSVQLGESSINTNVKELITNMTKETDKDLLQGGSIHADINEVTTKKGDKEIGSGESSVDCNSSVSQNNIAKNGVNTVLEAAAKEYKLPLIKFTTLLKLKEQSKKERVEFCIELGLIASKFKCTVCENDMVLTSKDIGDGYVWVCRSGRGEKSHKRRKITKSVRNGSFFTNSKLSFIDTIMVIHCWVYKLPRPWISMELEVNKATLTDWFDICRDICVEICARDLSKIGGKGTIVEIEGGQYERRKNDVNINKNSFVFIGTENMYGDKTFLKIAEKCDKNSFLEVIKSYVLPGSTVISEYCSLFKCRRDWDFVDLAKSCKYKFKDPKSTDLLKRKSFWNVIKRKLPSHRKDNGFDHHIAEYLWRKRNYSAYDKLRRFLLHLKTIYPPPTIDG